MTKASDNLFPKVLLDMQTSSPAAPSDRSWKMYAKADGLYARSSNSETKLLTGSGSALTDPMTTRGDIIVRDASNVTARLAVGSNKRLYGNGTDVSWKSSPDFSSITDKAHANYTTTGTTFADLDATNFSRTITTSGGTSVLVIAMFMASNSGASTTAFDVTVDSSRQGHSTLGLQGGNNGPWPVCISYLTPALAAGSHTFRIQWKVSAGTGTVFAATTGIATHFAVMEIGP